MRIVTGMDRLRYDQLVADEAKYEALVAQMVVQLEELKAYLAREQQRADNAVDELLTMKGLAPVSPHKPMELPMDDPWEEDPSEVDKWRKVIQEEGLTAALSGEGV